MEGRCGPERLSPAPHDNAHWRRHGPVGTQMAIRNSKTGKTYEREKERERVCVCVLVCVCVCVCSKRNNNKKTSLVCKLFCRFLTMEVKMVTLLNFGPSSKREGDRQLHPCS